MFFAAVRATAAPAPVEPVKDTSRTLGWPASGWPTRWPVPGTTWRTSSGSTVFSSSTMRMTVSGACSLGFNDDGVPDGEGRGELAAGVDRRPVERNDLADDADGFQVGRGVDGALVVEVGRELVDQAAEEAEDRGQEVDVVLARVLDGFSVLA